MTRQVSAGGIRVLLALLAAMALWASSFPIMKALLQAGFNPYAIIWGRMVFASLVLLPLMIRAWPRARRQKGDIWWLLLLVACEPGLYFLLEINALQYTSASQAGMVAALFPLLGTLGGALFFNERAGRNMLLGLFLSVGGVIGLTLAGDADLSAPRPWLGNFLEAMAMVMAVGYMLIIKKLTPRYDIWLLTGIQMAGGAIIYLPGAAYLLGEQRELFLQPFNLGLFIYIGAGVTVLAYGFYNYGVARLSAARAAVMVNLIPVFAVMISWLWLGERLNGLQIAFAALTLGGVILTQKSDRAATEAQEQAG